MSFYGQFIKLIDFNVVEKGDIVYLFHQSVLVVREMGF